MKKNKIENTKQRFKFVEPLQGESIEQKVTRILQSNEIKIKIPDNFSLIISIYLPKNKRELYTN